MILTSAKYGFKTTEDENLVSVIVMENPAHFTNLVNDIVEQCTGKDGELILSEDGTVLRFDKLSEIIINPFRINLNDKKILNKLYVQLEENAKDLIEQKEQLNSSIVNLLDEIVTSVQYTDIGFDLELDWNALFKMRNIHIESEELSFVEKIIEYTKELSSILRIRVLFLVNIKSYLNEEELEQVYTMAFYHKVKIILIESIEREKMYCEKMYIIDRDMCLVLK